MIDLVDSAKIPLSPGIHVVGQRTEATFPPLFVFGTRARIWNSFVSNDDFGRFAARIELNRDSLEKR
jgi:hypothetical protein